MPIIKISLVKSNRKATVFASCVVPTMPLFLDLISPWQSHALSHGPQQRREPVLVGHIDVYPSPKKRIPGEFTRLCHILFRSGFQSSSVVPWEVCHPRSRPRLGFGKLEGLSSRQSYRHEAQCFRVVLDSCASHRSASPHFAKSSI